MTQIIYYLGLVFFSIIVGLLGIFYRNILKMPNMVFNRLYGLFERMAKRGGFLKFIAYPLGYCIYCSTTWIAIIGFFIIYKVISWDILIPVAISHYIAMYFCKHYADLPGFKAKARIPKITDEEIREALGMTGKEYAEFNKHTEGVKR